MHWKLFADLAEITGQGEVDVTVGSDEPTIADALGALIERYPELEPRIYTDDGEIESHLNLLLNGENVSGDSRLSTPVSSNDELALFPPVSGG
ncbi:ubiquitin-like small modifier protein (SAMP) [Halohasta litchfieldiae]|jgi:molybdopterin synthase sulfur carrier subunit|uniref:Ubiquitin-like small archaeal modifier protein (SAMP) n=1 Tax=Halohasta litchfieldiae TaxID=1073996 RepID=A0A1H6S3G5_9EURY|nr:ubiquitin-like small modifier protein 1 [Halohasta litchfieldiae]ATW89246.1 ubiquitin-like small modifier protein (SAMP) [Halohasta litchfieldiae]SEI57982.1 ubiquitin-like small archaeal modifier protein (SAMP) [Halohasta litchfieldiae]